MNENAFSYTYSAACNQEVLNIRKKYLPREETKLEELKRLDSLVQNSGVMESLCAGIGGCLTFGLGLCLAMEVIGHMTDLGAILGAYSDYSMVIGIVVGLVGMVLVALAYPIYNRVLKKQREKIAPEILRLSDELLK